MWFSFCQNSETTGGPACGTGRRRHPTLYPLFFFGVWPTADPDRRAGNFVNLGLGLNFLVPSGVLQGTGLSVEGIIPVFQDLDGPQLERDYAILVGLRKAF